MNLSTSPGTLGFEQVTDDIDSIPGTRGLVVDTRVQHITLRQVLDEAWAALRCLDGDEIWRTTLLLEPFACSQPSVGLPSGQREIQTLVAVGLLWRDEPHRAIALAEALMARTDAVRFYSMLLTVLRFGFWRTRQFQAFYALSRPRFFPSSRLSTLAHIANLSIEAAAEAEQLRFKLSERLARDAIELSNKALGLDANTSLLPTCVLAQLAYESGAIEEADQLIRRRMAMIEQCGSVDTALLGFCVSASVAQARGNRDVALLILRRGEETGRRRGWFRLAVRCVAEQVFLHVLSERLDAAEEALTHLDEWIKPAYRPGENLLHDLWPIEVARCRIEFAKHRYESAAKGFRRLRDSALNRNYPTLVVRMTALIAACLYQTGDKARAQKELLDALRLGADTGLFRTFVEEMPWIETCLREVRRSLGSQWAPLNAYVISLLSAAASGGVKHGKKHKNHGVAYLLSAKETVILRLISSGLSNKSIARELCIAPETVKSHAKRIFIKLSAKTRAEAVARATDLHLI